MEDGEHERRSNVIHFEQTEKLVNEQREQISRIEKTLAQTPDPKTLRNIEHIIDELPPTDDIKECINHHKDSRRSVRNWTWGVLGVVGAFIAIAMIRVLWSGLGQALAQGGLP